MHRLVPLEKAAEIVCDENSTPPFIFQLPPEEGRLALEKVQSSPIIMYPAIITPHDVDTKKWGVVRIFHVKPDKLVDSSRVIFYIHGAGWVFGSFHTHEKLVRELAYRTNSTIIFPEYSRSPEAKFPTAIEQCYSILCMLPELAFHHSWNIDINTLIVAGDSVGGNMATVMTIMSKYRHGPAITKQLLYYPVTNACFDTCSYKTFAVDYYLYRQGMIWFWNQYTTSQTAREQIIASPLCASREQLRGLPKAMIINGEADVLRDEGEQYARNLRKADVDVTAVRLQAIIHDFVMLNSLDQTKACRAAMDLSVAFICDQ